LAGSTSSRLRRRASNCLPAVTHLACILLTLPIRQRVLAARVLHVSRALTPGRTGLQWVAMKHMMDFSWECCIVLRRSSAMRDRKHLLLGLGLALPLCLLLSSYSPTFARVNRGASQSITV